MTRGRRRSQPDPDDTAEVVGVADRTGTGSAGDDLGDLFEPEFLGFDREGSSARFATHAVADRQVRLELYRCGEEASFRSVDLEPDPMPPAPWSLWRAELDDLPESFDYLLRVDDGPELLDPYARLLSGGEEWGGIGHRAEADGSRRYRCRVAGSAFDWQNVAAPAVSPEKRVVYELHVRGFTRHESSGVSRPGTYLGLIEKLPYLAELGVTTLELLPVCEFDETENRRRNPETGERLFNYWGYNPISFFAPKSAYAAGGTPEAAAAELKELVREAHRLGLEVVLDVVYNHTAEGPGGEGGRTISWRGLDASGYYLVDPVSGRSLDLTGCGNTLRASHPVVRRLVLDSLRHWCEEYRIDGFRFDLAGAFFRGDAGEKLSRSPLVEAIGADEVVGGRWLSAEPWDASGFSPDIGFPAPWRIWDGRFRDELRRYVGDLEDDARPLTRLLGAGSRRSAGVRFVACHDGRPLADVVAYADKHNEANGEQNRDGWDGEVAWNGGVEGETDVAAVLHRRGRQVRSLVALLAAAPGTILLTAGDERGRSQHGNNNAWCQDGPLTWIDWAPTAEGEALRSLVTALLALRSRSLVPACSGPAAMCEPYFEGGGRNAAGFLLIHSAVSGAASLLVAINRGESTLQFPLPAAVQGKRWRLRVDTGRPPGREVFAEDQAPFLAYETAHLAVAQGSVRILTAERLSVDSES